MTRGRDTAYNQDMQSAADNYVNGGFDACGDAVPSRAGLAVELGVSRNTLTNWGEQFPDFLSTLDRLSALQERLSLSGGLRGDMNSTIVKLLLANHGYSDRQAVDHTTGGEAMQPNQIILTGPDDKDS